MLWIHFMERCGRDTPPLRLQTPIVPKISPNSQGWQVLILCSTLGSCQPGHQHIAHLGTPKRLKSQMHFAVSGWFCSVRKSLSVQVRSFWGPGVPDVSERSLNLCWPKARHASPAPMNRNASVASFTTCDATTWRRGNGDIKIMTSPRNLIRIDMDL